MRRMNSLSLLILILLSALVMSGCDRVNPPLTIATSKWPGYSFITLAEREGWLAEKNIQNAQQYRAVDPGRVSSGRVPCHSGSTEEASTWAPPTRLKESWSRGARFELGYRAPWR